MAYFVRVEEEIVAGTALAVYTNIIRDAAFHPDIIPLQF
jgi:hypothetical protein